ncbi:hypothetical protein NQ315_006043 [Exocentrus adspersus]|uniref:DDE Tnp4 domain-containing protein n=1 Tax=Exocentrus adspersus TaxID=1586481 RepID=A0AAV8VG87_9CUCU|nr:hypothetical protein NQ315_006043 [Exocentrus adspersus]
MEDLVGILTDDEDFIELIDLVVRQRRRKVFRQRENHFQNWNDTEFIKRNQAVSPEGMLLITLRFFATGSFLQVVGDFIGIDKSTASRIIWKVSQVIARLYREFIRMPSDPEEIKEIRQSFYNIARFPKCIGAVDCTHIRISSPGGIEPEIYRNRKGFFSMNVQAISDATGKFQNVVCRWPGSSHDSTIFNNSHVRAQFENGVYRDEVLVGDSGYGIRSYLITPLTNPNTPAEQLFNESQIRTRNPIERVFGVWKRRFPIVSFGIRVKTEKVEAIAIATAVLHNIAHLLKEPLPPVAVEEEAALDFVNAANNMLVIPQLEVLQHFVTENILGKKVFLYEAFNLPILNRQKKDSAMICECSHLCEGVKNRAPEV